MLKEDYELNPENIEQLCSNCIYTIKTKNHSELFLVTEDSVTLHVFYKGEELGDDRTFITLRPLNEKELFLIKIFKM